MNALHEIKKIAIFRALQLGDLLCTIPTIRAIRNYYPNATIALIGLPWQESLATRFKKYFDEFIEFPGWPGLPEQNFNPAQAVRFVQEMQSRKFDLVFQMQGNGILTNAMCMLWGARQVVGLRKQGEYTFDPQYFPISEDTDHEILRFIKLLDPLGIPAMGTTLEFPITNAEEIDYEKTCHTLGIMPHEYICIHPGARDPRRRWSASNFAALINNLAPTSTSIVLTGSPEELAILNEIEERTHVKVTNTIRLLGDVSLPLLACFIKNAKLLISNDTGVSHIASALQAPSIIIFSKFSDINRWRPLNVSLHRAITAERADVNTVTDAAFSALSQEKIILS